MPNTEEKNEAEQSETVQVLVRLTKDELAQLMSATGTNAYATAVACFCRIHLRK